MTTTASPLCRINRERTRDMCTQKANLIRDLAVSTGVAEEDVAAILDELGLSETLTELGRQFGQDTLELVARTDLRLAIRMGRLLVTG